MLIMKSSKSDASIAMKLEPHGRFDANPPLDVTRFGLDTVPKSAVKSAPDRMQTTGGSSRNDSNS